MPRVFLRKLLLPDTSGSLLRPRLFDLAKSRVILVQAPPGCGKTTLLAQWLRQLGTPSVYYQMDRLDQEGESFAAHLLAGFRRAWPDWSPPDGVERDPVALGAELVNEAMDRPPTALVLDQVESAFRQPFLTDFIELLLRYGPPSLTVAIGTRAPLPFEPDDSGPEVRLITASDLAFTREEAESWLGPGEWAPCFESTGGSPVALQFWNKAGAGWRTAAVAHILARMPSHVTPGTARALVTEWIEGRLPLAEYSHKVSQGQPGAESLWAELHEARALLISGQMQATREHLLSLWDKARSSGDRKLMGATATLLGESHYVLGEFGQAMEWTRRALEADPILETTGSHCMVPILMEQGHIIEAEVLARRCLEVRQKRGDLQALVFAHFQLARLCMSSGQFSEAEQHFLETERLGMQFLEDSLFGVLGKAYRAQLLARQGMPAAYRRLAEEAYQLARGRVPVTEALCAGFLAPALIAWGEKQAGLQLLEEALNLLAPTGARWHQHIVHLLFARELWSDGQQDKARGHFDRALSLAVAEGYVQQLVDPWMTSLPLLLDALVRGVEVPFCQELLIRRQESALPALLEMMQQPEPRVRKALLYPLASIGGAEALGAVRVLLNDPDEEVQAAAILALQALRQTEERPTPVKVGEAPGDAPEGAMLSIAMMGRFDVITGGQRVQGWRTTKSRDLLAYLVLHVDRPVTRDQILEALWPDSGWESAQSIFHSTLYYLRRALKPAGDNVITFAGGAYRMNKQVLDLDLNRFHRYAAARNSDGWRAAIGLYKGELLEGLDYPWCAAPRARTREAFLEALRSLASCLQGANDVAGAVEWLQLLVQEEPLSEEAHVRLMECYAALGKRYAALQQYRTMAQLLQEELGLEPGHEAQALYRRLLD